MQSREEQVEEMIKLHRSATAAALKRQGELERTLEETRTMLARVVGMVREMKIPDERLVCGVIDAECLVLKTTS